MISMFSETERQRAHPNKLVELKKLELFDEISGVQLTRGAKTELDVESFSRLCHITGR